MGRVGLEEGRAGGRVGEVEEMELSISSYDLTSCRLNQQLRIITFPLPLRPFLPLYRSPLMNAHADPHSLRPRGFPQRAHESRLVEWIGKAVDIFRRCDEIGRFGEADELRAALGRTGEEREAEGGVEEGGGRRAEGRYGCEDHCDLRWWIYETRVAWCGLKQEVLWEGRIVIVG